MPSSPVVAWKRLGNLVEILRSRADRSGFRGYAFESEADAGKVQTLNFAELDRRARGLAAVLQDQGLAGKTALLYYPAGLEFLVGLFGCLYAGTIAVPTNMSRARRADCRFAAIAADAGAAAVLTATAFLDHSERLTAGNLDLRALRWLDSSDVPEGYENRWRPPAIGCDDPTILQYTSGSTGSPKGVILTHSCLLHNLQRMFEVLGLFTDAMVVCWLPAFHDMGLIGNLLQAVSGDFRMHLMSPVSFLRDPLRWLQAITRERAFISGGPNFALELCVQRAARTPPEELARLDLRSWQVAYIGAEPIAAGTFERFLQTFGPYGYQAKTFFPCYGLAEATLMVSGGPGRTVPRCLSFDAAALEAHRVVRADDPAKGRQVVGCGQPLADMEVALVDPATGNRCAPGEIGEIWVHGPSVAAGYWQRPDETAETFAAVLPDKPGRHYLRTGDLGFLHEGELFVTGRLKELIIIRGRNFYPQDLEQAVQQEVRVGRIANPSHGQPAAAFAIEDHIPPRLVLVQEVDRGYVPGQAGDLFRQVRQIIAEQFELELHDLVLIRSGTLPRSSSGKIRRGECQRRFLAQELKVVEHFSAPPVRLEPAGRISNPSCNESVGRISNPSHNGSNGVHGVSERALIAWLSDRVAQHAQITAADVDVDRPFAAYGLDSVGMVAIANDLEKWLGRSLSPTLLYDAPTIVSLSRRLASEARNTAGANGVAHAEGRIANPSYADVGGKPSAPPALEAIAIVGVGCRFPEADSPAEFWRLLREGRHVIGDLPASRQALHTASGRGGFLGDVDAFDGPFFGITPREARLVDPQHRVVLEVAWETLEYAGINPRCLDGGNIGVFVGIANADYSWLVMRSGAHQDAYAGAGNARALAANRLSYHLNLRGPSVSVDTACSSSLVAVHLACQSIRTGDCDMALAGGVNLILSPELSESLTQAQMLSPSGLCKTFDAGADGYVRGEGCGMVLLKPLSAAVRDQDMILAVIEGSAINQDGRTSGITAPSAPAQTELIQRALRQAGRPADAVSYVEAHGTGTSLGDPIEFDALNAAIGTSANPCALGAVKTNLGHLEAAAGIAGLIKVVLQLQHNAIAPLVHFTKLNPLLRLEGSRFRLPQSAEPWPSAAKPRVAGVSSFSFGGTNAHVVLADAPVQAIHTANGAGPGRTESLLPLSAKNEQALKELASRYRDFLQSAGLPDLGDICFTAGAGRAHFDHRLVLQGSTHAEMRESLERFLAGAADARTLAGTVRRQPGLQMSLPPRGDDQSAFLSGIARLYVDGADIPWHDLDDGGQRRRVVLPSYPFQRQRYWAGNPQPAAAPLESPEPAAAELPAACGQEIIWLPRSQWSQELPRRPFNDAVCGQAIVQELAPVCVDLRRQHNLGQFASLRAGFDALSARYVKDTFGRLGWPARVGASVDADILGRGLRVLPKYQRLLRRLLALAAEDGWLRMDRDKIVVAGWPEPGDAAEAYQDLTGEFPAFRTELALAHRCATHMAGVMQGTCDPLHVLFGEEAALLTEQLYEKSPFARFYNELLAASVRTALAALPADRPIRILELGAGTGGTTAHVAPALPADRVEYVFSDVSGLFLSRAREKFHAFPFLQYRLLDLEKDPREQGFAHHQFDLILATNVLHATPDVRQSLANARRGIL